MRLRTFSAATLDDAITLVRDALGEEAVIVSTYQSRRGRGAQVTAALDETDNDDALASTISTEEAQYEPDDEIAKILRFHRLDNVVSHRIACEVRSLGRDDIVLALAGALDSLLSFAALPSHSDVPVMVVGPPGVGKTVTVIKIAARAVLEGRRVHVLTTDTVRSGAFEQLAAMTGMMNVPLRAIETPAELTATLDEIHGADLVLIDTPACNPFAPREVEDLKTFAAAGAARQVLVLSAGYDSADVADTAEIFAAAGADAVHITRLDCARRYGGIIAAAVAGRMPITEASATPFIANGLSSLSSVSLARLLNETAFKRTERTIERATS